MGACSETRIPTSKGAELVRVLMRLDATVFRFVSTKFGPASRRSVTTMSPNKRVKIYTAEDVQSHKSPSSCWVTRGDKVYDVSAFLPDHPGGDDIIIKYAGQDIQKAMKDHEEHDHSDSAYGMMEEYLIGRLGNNANIVDESGSTAIISWPTTNG